MGPYKTIRIQSFNWQVGRLGYMRKCTGHRTGIFLWSGDSNNTQHWKYLFAGFYWRNV